MNKGGTVGDPLNAALVRGGEATRQGRMKRRPYRAARKGAGGEMGTRQRVCAHAGAVGADPSFGDAARPPAFPRRSRSLPDPATTATVGEARELREPDLRDKRMVAEVVPYNIHVSGAYFTRSNGASVC